MAKKEKKVSRKELRKMQARLDELNKLGEESDNIDGYNGLNINKSTLHDLLAPSGIDATHYDYLEIFSKVSRFARTFYVTTIPRQAVFPYFSCKA